jgi:hypothetical protein
MSGITDKLRDDAAEPSALVQRLRGRAEWYREVRPETVKTPELLNEAATEIESLRARAGELETERAELRAALEAAEYVPGDHPVVPVKIAAFMAVVRTLTIKDSPNE